MSSWQCPPAAASEDRKLGFLNESCEEGANWLKSQRGYPDFRKAMEVLAGKNDDPTQIAYRSKLNTNRLKRNIREVVGALSNIRPLWGYHSDNDAFSANAEMMNKVTRAIYLEQFFDRSLKEALQYAAATCTGWVRPVYRRNQAGKGKGNIQLLTYGSPCVLPVQMPSNNDWQEAYSVSLLDEMPIYMAHSLFPDFQDRLHPTSSKYWYSSEIRKSSHGNLWKRMWSGMFKRDAEAALSDLYIPIRYTYVIDLTVNTTGQMIPMGEIGSPWCYEVPSLGSDIPVGRDREGNVTSRKANENDARLYPYRRLLISSENCICYDGPAFDWHGELPLIPFCVDDWPWEAIGFSLVHDGYEIQQAINELERGMMDKYRAQLDLPLGYDINAVSLKEAKQFDPMQPRARIGYDGSQVDRPFAPVVPPEVYRVEPELMVAVRHYEETMDYQMAIRDVVALAKAKALGKGSDQLEALMEAQGPVVKDISRSMERSLCRIGSQLKFLVMQYLDTARLMQYVGEDGITQEIFDYDPTSLIPSHMPGEPTTDVNERPLASMHSKLQRARWFAENLRFFLMPHSVHEITQMTHRLMLLQMRQRGLPIDSRTIAEACNVGNFGNKPEGNTVYERFQNEKIEELTLMVRLKAIAQELGIDMGALGGGKGGGGKGGRPPSGQAAPELKRKGDGRPVVTESQ
jgi:hypothetical protein